MFTTLLLPDLKFGGFFAMANIFIYPAVIHPVLRAQAGWPALVTFAGNLSPILATFFFLIQPQNLLWSSRTQRMPLRKGAWQACL
jgi:hypothetical protein